MTNPNFSPTISTNEIYRDLNTAICLTDELDGYDSSLTTLQSVVTSKADSDHTHDGYATTESVAALQTTISGKADSNHTHDYAASSHSHDDIYYTESEIDSKLSGKSDISHTHSASDITGLSTSTGNGITESGTSGIWTYEKYDNGKLVCEGLLTCSGVFNKRYWEMRYRDATEAYPVAFVTSPPMVQATAQCDIGFPQVTVYNNTLTTIGVRAFNPHDPVHDVKVAIRAVGKWK